MKIFYSVCLICITSMLYAQNQDHYLFQAEKFSPPERALIAQYEGFPVTPIQASDIDGVQHNVSGGSGTQILWFWNEVCHKKRDLIFEMNKIAKSKDVKLLCFADETKTEIHPIAQSLGMNFSIIPNSSMLSQAVYASELGYPRAFLVNDAGLVVRVFPASMLLSSDDISSLIIGSLNQ